MWRATPLWAWDATDALPWASGRLVDAVAAGPSSQDLAWVAWALFVGVYLVGSLMRNLAPRFWIPLAARNMRDLVRASGGLYQPPKRFRNW